MVSVGMDWEENPGLEREEIIKEQEKKSHSGRREEPLR